MVDIAVVRVLKIIVVVLGLAVTALSVRSFRRVRSRGILLLGIGFALITLGAVVAGVLFEFAGFPFVDVSAVEAGIVALGLAVILYSIYGTRT